MNLSEGTVTNKLKQGLFILFIAVLLFPLAQSVLPILKEKSLEGVDPAAPLPIFSIASWSNNEYQEEYLSKFEQNIGFHNSLVRFRNQINYSLFGFSDAGNAVVGKNNYIYNTTYIDAYTGVDFIGRELIDLRVRKIKLVQEELKKKNIDFFIILAPGKGSFYPEFIPDKYIKKINPDSTNYSCYKKTFSAYNVNTLDLKSHFLSIKNSVKYPLYNTTGVHWTEYGCYIAGVEITKYIEHLRNIKLPEIKIESIKMLSLAGNKSNDYDEANMLNIFTTVPHYKVAIPKLRFTSDASTTKPRFLCVSDSYFAGIINTRIPGNVFNDYQNWLYYDRVYPESFSLVKSVNKKELKKEIEKEEVVCILATDATLSAFPYGFIDDAYEVYAKKDSTYYALLKREYPLFIRRTLNDINRTPDWKKSLIERAKAKNVPENYEFLMTAVWLFEQQHLIHKNE